MSTLFVSDLDGTLLNEKAELSLESRLGLERLLAHGVLFTVASARSLYSIRNILGHLPIQLPVISFNGGFTSNYQTGEHYSIYGLEAEVVAGIEAALDSHRLHPFVSTNDGVQDHLYVGHTLNPAMQWFYDERIRENDTRLRQVDDVNIAYREVVTCISVMGEFEPLHSFLVELNRTFGARIRPHLFENLYSEGSFWLTIHPAQATKANAIQALVKGLDVSVSRLVVFGDQHNDTEMFKLAHEAIAVENAVSELKALASECIGRNDTNSVVKYIINRVF